MRTILWSVLDPLHRVLEGRLMGTRGIYLLGFIGILKEGLIPLILQLLVLQLEKVRYLERRWPAGQKDFIESTNPSVEKVS